MGVSSIEERKTTCCLSPKIYQAPSEDMDTMTEFPRKKKMFSSSSFYEEPNAIYPTVEEQVNLCRKIAESLSDDCNLKSKGANMFFKRVKKAEKWIVAESNNQNEVEAPDSSKDPTQMPYVKPKGLSHLRLILDPRHIVDMKRLLKEGVDIVEHNAVSPEICHDIVKDLNSPTGKGGQLFAKRKKKSEEWVVDEEKVKFLLQTRYQGGYSSPEPPAEPQFKNSSEISSQEVADSVIRAAEAKVMTYPNAIPHVPIIESLDRVDDAKVPFFQSPVPSYMTPNPWSSEAYKFRVPRGWTSTPTTSSSTIQGGPPSLQAFEEMTPALQNSEPRSLATESPLQRSFTFANFNSSPRAWNANIPNQFRPAAIKPVKPPSFLMVQ